MRALYESLNKHTVHSFLVKRLDFIKSMVFTMLRHLVSANSFLLDTKEKTIIFAPFSIAGIGT